MLAAKRLLRKAVRHHHHRHQDGVQRGNLAETDLDLQVAVHYGVPSTSSLLAFDPIQRLLAIGTLDGRIKVIGGDGIEGLLMSPKQLPYKNIEFLQNKGFLVGISNENDIQVWNLESRCLACSLQWESNITAFAVISGSYFMYIGDEYGMMSVLKYDTEDVKLVQLPYYIPANSLVEAAGLSSSGHQHIVSVLPQPCSYGDRLLIAYESGLIVLWDVSEGQILFTGGNKDLQLKDGVLESQSKADTNPQDDASYHHLQDKEITAVCWASSSGSILAVGYIDGDILFWKTSTMSSAKGQQHELPSNSVVKLQLSSAQKRLPIIVLHWLPSNRSNTGSDGQLFIYGGDEVGSKEVLTVLTLEWSSGMEMLRCAGRVGLTLTGSFADMILLPSAGPTGGNRKDALLVLTNPGQLHLYDDASLSALLSRQESSTSVFAVELPAAVPIAAPRMTTSKLTALPSGVDSSKIQFQIASVKKQSTKPAHAGGLNCPLTGGVPSQFSLAEPTVVERLYLAGYQDGTIRLWDATYASLSLICVLEDKLQGIKVDGLSAPISNLDFCFPNLSLAVGNECGLVCIYNLNSSSENMSFSFVTETKREDHIFPQGKGPHCRAVFSLLNSRICALQFANSGVKLAVGFECGRVAILDMNSISVLFFTDSASGFISPVISVTWIEHTVVYRLKKIPKHSDSNNLVNPAEEVVFLLTKDATINIIDGSKNNAISPHPCRPKKKSTAISMYVIESSTSVSELTDERQLEESGKDVAPRNDSIHNTTLSENSLHDDPCHSSLGVALTRESLMDSFVLLCCEDSLRLYSLKNLIQGHKKHIGKVKHAKPCRWTSTFKKGDKVSGIVLLFQTGVIEIRSFPELELVKETSLMQILRWNFKANMEKRMSSSDNGQITLENGCELAIISLLGSENCFRIPESFPCLHDKVLAAAADAAFDFSSNQKKKQGTKPGILGGIVKGLKGGKLEKSVDHTFIPKSSFIHLEGFFSKPPFSDKSPTVADSKEVMELDIDDIEIDEPPPPTATTSAHEVKKKGTEREQLLGNTDDIKPRLRTPEEIMAQYRKAGDASSVAAHARNKLVERQEKLERISRRTAELQSGAEDFASLANELVKTLENRKWWQM